MLRTCLQERTGLHSSARLLNVGQRHVMKTVPLVENVPDPKNGLFKRVHAARPETQTVPPTMCSRNCCDTDLCQQARCCRSTLQSAGDSVLTQGYSCWQLASASHTAVAGISSVSRKKLKVGHVPILYKVPKRRVSTSVFLYTTK